MHLDLLNQQLQLLEMLLVLELHLSCEPPTSKMLSKLKNY